VVIYYFLKISFLLCYYFEYELKGSSPNLKIKLHFLLFDKSLLLANREL